jgi:hypothetical protein
MGGITISLRAVACGTVRDKTAVSNVSSLTTFDLHQATEVVHVIKHDERTDVVAQ